MIELKFIGAAKTVTGSKHLIKTSQACVLLDCGLFQGHRKESYEKNKNFSLDGTKIDAIVLSHAHIDHSGALPCIYKNGYRGPIYATSATRDLCLPMLLDTAGLMQSDAEHIQKLIDRGVKRLEVIEPLYNQDDVNHTISQFVCISYGEKRLIAPGISLTFINAGHVLGSSICILDIDDKGKKIRLAFTGDLGRKHLPILSDPEIPDNVNVLLMESTYGDRLHSPIELSKNSLAQIITKTYHRNGKIIIPTFALERAQELIYVIKQLYSEKKTPKIPVFVDSPLTVKLTEVFRAHPECYDQKTFKLLNAKNSPFDFKELTYITSVEDSKKLSSSIAPAIIISASGMCEGGRVLHHLISSVENYKNTILIVGFQAENTLGKRIVEKHEEIKIFGNMYKLSAEVFVLNGFSGHADQRNLLEFVNLVQKKGNLDKIILVHGEYKAQEVLKSKLQENNFFNVLIPDLESVLKL